MTFTEIPLGTWTSRRLARGHISIAGYVFAAVLALRLIALARLAMSASPPPLSGDAAFYHEWALRIANGELTDHRAFYALPLYAYLLAAIYKVAGVTFFVPALLQSCADAGTAALLFKLGKRIFDEPSEDPKDLTRYRGVAVGLLASVAWAFFVPAQSYSLVLMPTAYSAFVWWYFVWQVVKRTRRPPVATLFFWGVFIGFAATGVATILFILPLLIFALSSRWAVGLLRQSLPGSIALAAILLMGVVCGSSPCWLHNLFIAHDPIILSAHGGVNFWVGNNPEATGYPNFPGLPAAQTAMLTESIQVAETAVGRPLKRSEVSGFWAAKARAFVAAQPGAWVRLIGRKIGNFWNSFQYDDIGAIRVLRDRGIVVPGPMFGLLVTFAFPAMLLSWRRNREARWATVAVFLQMASLLPVFITERYRLPAAPGLALFASACVWDLWQYLTTRSYAALAQYAILTGLGAVGTSVPRPDTSLYALDYYSAGRQALEANALPLAEKELSVAYAYVSTHPEINLALGNLRLAQGKVPLAARHYQQTLVADPEHKAALNNLAVIALRNADWSTAENYVTRALRLDSENPKAHFLMAKIKLAQGDYRAAEREIDMALRSVPQQSEYVDLRDEIRNVNRLKDQPAP